MKSYLIGMIVLLAAIMSPLTARAEFVNDRSTDPYYVGEKAARANQARANSMSDPYYYANNGGIYTEDQNQKAEGYSINADLSLGKLGRVNVGYAKATQKSTAKAQSKPNKMPPIDIPEENRTCSVDVATVRSVQTWLVDIKSNQPICPIVIDRPEKLRQFKSEIAVDRSKKELVRYKVMNISDDISSVTLTKGQVGPLSGDKIIFVIVTKEGVSPQPGDNLRVRY